MKTESALLKNQIDASLTRSGWFFKMVSVKRIGELEAELHSLHADGLFDELFYKELITYFSFQLPDEMPDAKSIIVIAAPQPIQSVTFTVKGEDRAVHIPPTYDSSMNRRIKAELEKVLSSGGYQCVPASLPLKLLAIHSGLVEYGRNNISYIPGKGSYHRLSAYYTDLFSTEDVWQKPVMMERCQRCSICIDQCPTAAITADRVLLKAERCLTYHNEEMRELPEYIKQIKHHCLVGCMICQRVCPENAKVKDWIEETVRFTEEETIQILDGVTKEELAEETCKKLESIQFLDYLALISRNLKLIFA